MMRTLRCLALATVALSLAACGAKDGKDKSDDDDADAVAAALDADDGAMTLTDEKPYFGDAAFQNLAELVPAPTELQDAGDGAAANVRSYHLAILWGHLPAANDATDADPDPQPIDWTGSVSVAKGAVGVSRTLAFDTRDHLVRDGSKTTVSFVSRTLPMVDGLFLHVVLPADAPQTLHFDTPSLKTDIDLASLKTSFVGGQRLGDGRNGMVYGGYPDVQGCARGLVFGRWLKVQPGLGKLRGRVMNGDGETIGHVKGIWGHAPKKGANVFFGKAIGAGGEFHGLFGGTYGGGEGKGLWRTRDPKDAGGIQIEYFDGYEKHDGHGIWLGRWSEACGQ